MPTPTSRQPGAPPPATPPAASGRAGQPSRRPVSAMRSPVRLPGLALVVLAGVAGAGTLTVAAPPAAAQSTPERERQRERQRERAERDRERQRARAERERERAAERVDRERERERERDRHDDDAAGGTQPPTRIDTVVSVGRDAHVDLSLVSGNVTVTSWDRGDVQVRGYSERLPLRFSHQDGRVRVWVPNSQPRGRSGAQRLEVVVPVGSRVAAQTVSGNVSVRGVRGELEAGAVSGDVDAHDAVRRVSLNSVSGSVRGTNVEGDVRANSVSGEVVLDDVRGDIDAETVSGEVAVRRATTSRLRMQSVSGELTYDGTIARDGRYEFNSHSGEIRLAIPRDAGASLSLRTFSGSIDTDFPLTLQPDGRDAEGRTVRRGDRRMDFTLGGGGARIVAETFSGTIHIGRRPSDR